MNFGRTRHHIFLSVFSEYSLVSVVISVLVCLTIWSVPSAFSSPFLPGPLSFRDESTTDNQRKKPSSRKRQEESSLPVLKKNSPAPSKIFVERQHLIIENTKRYAVHIEYPSIGVTNIDTNIALWARQRINFFTSSLADIPASDPSHFILNIIYQRFQSSPLCTSLVFYITTNTGGIQSEQGLITSTYLTTDGRRLELPGIFEKHDQLIHFLSLYASHQLSLRQWEEPAPSLIAAGTAPDPINFSLFALDAKGIILFFPPGQVASITEGPIQVSIPLESLKQFQPNTALWENTGPK